MHVVLVEDNQILAKSMVRVLKQEGYTTTHFADGSEAQNWLVFNESAYDLVILDILLPGMNGFEISQAVRTAGITTPVLMLTSKDTVEDTIMGLDVGADDYLKKPFEIDELLARMRSLLRRPALSVQEVLEVMNGVTVNMQTRTITTSAGETINLTNKEFSILVYFIRNPNVVLDQQHIYDHVFDFAEVQLSNAIEVHIKNIRKKFKAVNYEIPIKTIRGAGYRLEQ